MDSPYKKKPIQKHKPRPFKNIMQSQSKGQNKPMDVDVDDNDNNMDID